MTDDEYADRLTRLNERYDLSLDPANPTAVQDELQRRELTSTVNEYRDERSRNVSRQLVRLRNQNGFVVACAVASEARDALLYAVENLYRGLPCEYQ